MPSRAVPTETTLIGTPDGSKMPFSQNVPGVRNVSRKPMKQPSSDSGDAPAGASGETQFRSTAQ